MAESVKNIKRQDYTGMTFGHLTVVEMLYGYGSHGEAYCRCVCDCGNECVKQVYGIRHSSNPPHCGCRSKFYREAQSNKQRKDITGERFGALIVTGMEYEHGKQSVAICRCDCGTVIKRPITYLTSGETTSCGCVQKARASAANTKDLTGIVSDYGVEFLHREYQDRKHKWHWMCRCGVCGKEFVALPAKILNGHITSCGCSRESSGERLVENILVECGVNYIREYSLNGCRNVHPLRLDFYLPDHNIGIEYHGKQHFIPIDLFGGEEQFNIRVEFDNKKRNYCKENNIQLIEVPYTLSSCEIRNTITNTIYPERLSC